MVRDDLSPILVLIVGIVALAGSVLALTSFAVHRSTWGMMGGGMMGSQPTSDPGPGGFEWALLIASVAFFAMALALVFRDHRTPHGATAAHVMPSARSNPAPPRSASGPMLPEAPARAGEPVPELTLVRLLDEDERRIYLEIRDHGGTMYQKDIVALGMFSKAKVTRVLDKLEAKRIVVRERHGMTNRVRILERTK